MITAATAVTLTAQPAAAPNDAVLLATIRAARDGDSRAFEDLMLLTEKRIARLAWRILGDAEEARDATQEVFLRVYRALDRFDERHSFHGWVFSIAVNVCRDFAARSRRSASVFEPITQDLDPADPAAGGAEISERRQKLELLARALDMLPPREKLAVVLRDIEELPTEEVARLLGSRPATVRVQISSARTRMRRWLESWLGRSGE